MPYANNKDADQYVHPRSLLSISVIYQILVDTIDTIPKSSRLGQASKAKQAGMS